jgi:teichuronic acid biosynthesis glycosyltransferase TuaG
MSLVSIITPTFNSASHIKETYNSILNQTYTNWEWLITDDCSTDGTFELLESFANFEPRIKIHKNQTNSGAAISRNNSINSARGDFIAFIDSDDLWHCEKLEKQIEFMEKNKIDFSFTAYEIINVESMPIGRYVDSNQHSPVTYEDMLKKKATLGCSTVILRKARFKDIEMPLLRTGQDYALWLKLLKEGVNAHPLSDILMMYRILPNSISRNKFRKSLRQWQIYREIERLSLSKSLYCFFFYGWRAVFRK